VTYGESLYNRTKPPNQENKLKTKEVLEGNDCGIQVETKIDIAPGDVLEAFEVKIV